MPVTHTHPGPEAARLNKVMGQAGLCSRREADALISSGLVSIEGEVVLDAGRKIEPGQTLTLSEAASEALSGGVTIMIHKPVGLVSGQPEPGKIPAVRLLTAENLIGDGPVPAHDASLPPIGRLDEDSRGLLLLSSDGVVAKAVIGPSSDLDKEYRIRVTGELTERALNLLRHGLMLDGRVLKRAQVTQLDKDRLKVVLREGRNRQIRRMAEMVGLRVTDLKRVRIGPLQMGDLPEGKWRHLTPDERAALLGQTPSG